MRTINFVTFIAFSFSGAVFGADIRIADRDTAGLIRAIQQANQSQRTTTIKLARHGLYTLTAATDGQPAVGLPALTGKIVIDGNKAEIRRYADSDFALLAVNESANVRIHDLTLAEGSEGAIVNRGKLQLRRVNVIDNLARHHPAIVENYGDIRIIDSEISHNQLDGAERDAGTVLNYGSLYIDGSRIAGNWISRRYGSLYAASAVLNYGDLKLRGVQINENTAEAPLDERSSGAILNLGNGMYSGTAVDISGNEPPASNQVSSSWARMAQ